MGMGRSVAATLTAFLLLSGDSACERRGSAPSDRPDARAEVTVPTPMPPPAVQPPDPGGLPAIAGFLPDQAEIESIPISALDSTWSGVRVLTDWDGESTTFGGRERLAYAHDGDFNGDGVKDRALVGVFRTTTGEQGRFLLILTERPGGGWGKAFLVTREAGDGFSILGASDSTSLSWLHCLECDTWSYVVWTGSEYRLEWVSCCDAPEDDSLGPA